MTRSQAVFAPPSRGTRVRAGWFALLAAALLLPAFDAPAQDDEEDQAAREEAAAAARAAAEERERQQVFGRIQQQIREFRAREAELMQQKEAQARRELAEQQRRTQEMVARRDRAEAYSQELDRRWEANEAQIDEISALLRQHEGNLGELFGVTRQIAGDAAGVLRESLIGTQFRPVEGEEERSEFMVRIAAAKALPSIRELERVWYELMREMKASGEVVRYTTDVIQLDPERAEESREEGSLAEQVAAAGGEAPEENALGEAVPMEVVRVGSFTAVSGDQFLGYLRTEKKLTQLDGELAGYFRAIAADLSRTPPDAAYTAAVVDPASGALLGLYLQRPSWLERIALGEAVGYVIIAVGILGVLLALFQYAYLLRTRLAVRSQLKDLSRPRDDNPLGRLLLAFGGRNGQGGGAGEPESAELAELRLSEAVLREVPKLERFQAFLRLAVAAGPLLGLIGTVIGMIITFHAIVASGSSDPKLMAHGIGQAMIATVLGLGIAIPLLFINAGLTAFSRGITQVLDEQSEALLAETILESRKG